MELLESLRQINIGALVIDHEHNIRFADQRVCDWHDSKQEDLLFRDARSLLHPSHRELDFVARDNFELVDIEAPMLNRSGESMWVRIRSLHPLSEGADTILLFENILSRKQDERQSKITQKLELLGQITGGVAHDFNNILAIVLGYIDLMIADYDSLKTQDAHRYLNHMRDASNRARNLVRQLLLYSRGDVKSSLEQQNIAAGIADTLPLIRTSLQEEIYLTTNIEVDSAIIEMDPAHLHQILMNLCINARDAENDVNDRDGEIIIGVQHHDPAQELVCASCQAKLGAHEQDNFVVLTVTDNGPGVDSTTLEHIFDPFYTTKSVNKGSGMGLSVVHGLVHQYGGHIQVLNSNYGVQFRLLLPLSQHSAVSASDMEPSRPPAESFNWRVLIVEDDQHVANVLEKLLEQLSITVVHRKNGLEALELLKQDQSFDLVITDHSMPMMTGMELAQATLDVCPMLPFVVLTGNSIDIDEADTPINVLRLLDKPITTQELSDAIKFVAEQPARLVPLTTS